MEQEDDERSMVQQILQKSTEFLRRIIVPVGRPGGATLSYRCPHCHRCPLEDYIWWVLRHGEKQSNWWCAACGGQCDWRNSNRVLVFLDTTDRGEAKVFRADATPNGVRENFVCALKLLGNPPCGSDTPVKVLVEVFKKKTH